MAVAYARRSFPGGAIATTIPTGMGSGDTSFTLAAATNWSVANNFYVVVDRGLSTEEKIGCSGITSLTVTVASGGRGADGTSAQAHSAGCTVQVCHVAQDDDEANQVVSAVLGQSGAAKGDILTMLSAAGPNTLQRVALGTTGSILQATSGGIPGWLTAGATNSVLISNGTAASPSWGQAPGFPVITRQTLGSDTSALGTTTPTNLCSISLTGAGTFTLTASALAYNASGDAEFVTAFLGTTTASKTGALVAGEMVVGTTIAGAQAGGSIPLGYQVTQVGTTTYFLEAISSGANAIIRHLDNNGVVNGTYLQAQQIA